MSKDIRNAAISRLARREYSKMELYQYLVKKFDANQVDDELLWLANEGLQSDQRFTESFIRNSIMRGRGPMRIKDELRSRGISSGMIDDIFEEMEIDWFAVMQQVYSKKYTSDPDCQKERACRLRFLQQRGFGFDLIRKLLN